MVFLYRIILFCVKVSEIYKMFFNYRFRPKSGNKRRVHSPLMQKILKEDTS